MRLISNAITFLVAYFVTTLGITANAVDLYTETSPWEVMRASEHTTTYAMFTRAFPSPFLENVTERELGTSANQDADQVIVICSACVGMAESLASGDENLTMPLPHYDGTISRFSLKRTTDDVIAKELQAQFPDAQTYYGRNIKGVTVEIDSTVTGGVRVQYHGAHGDLSYMDHVRSDDPDLSMAADVVQSAVANNVPVFRVYRRVIGRRASEVLASSEFKCSTNSTKTHSTLNSERRLQKTVCKRNNWHADGYCDPVNNVEACNYDGGDCCGRVVNKSYCTAADGGGPDSEACSCHDPSFHPDANGCIVGLIGDGFCDAANNKEVCGNDARDCCGVFADRSFCDEGENCRCPDDAELKTFPGHIYRIAIGTSQGYSAFHGDTVKSVLAEVLTAVNRIGGIYKRSLNIGLQLFGDTTKLFELSTTDPASFDENGNAIPKATQIFQEKLGSVDGFDLGHIFFSTGNSYVTGRACSEFKANGGSGSTHPVSDGYYVDFLAHEIGHQFAGGHTWTGSACASGQFVQSSGVEPGSGGTIMAYAGICGSDNVQTASDAYFSLVSLEQIHNFALSNFNGNTCGIAAPKVIAPDLAPKLGFPQGKCQIPSNTSFVLAPQISDILLSAKQDARLSYSWEQADVGTEARPIGVHEFGPIFRSQVPIDEPVRYFPSPASHISGETIPGEPLQWLNRDFRFSLTVRDTWQLESHSLDDQVDLMSGRGSYAADYVAVSVADVGPFEIENIETGINDATITVSWNTQVVESLLANNGAMSNTKVSLSYDNGVTFNTSSSFKFSDGEAIVMVKSCTDGQANHNAVAVLVEVESVAGCSFYAAESVGKITCPPTSSPTTTPSETAYKSPSVSPSKSTLSPTQRPPIRTPTGKPSNNPTASPSIEPTSTPSSKPTSRPSRTATIEPASKPTNIHTAIPSKAPSAPITRTLTTTPTLALHNTSSSNPNKAPTKLPSALQIPNNAPTATPNEETAKPTYTQSTETVTSTPTTPPTASPSKSTPTNSPSLSPSELPGNAQLPDRVVKLPAVARTTGGSSPEDTTNLIVGGIAGSMLLVLAAILILRKRMNEATMNMESGRATMGSARESSATV